MSPGSTGIGGSSVSGLRPPGSGNEGLGGSFGSNLGARPLPGLSGMSGVTPTLDEPVGETPTIPLRRPNRAEPVAEAPAEAPPAPPQPRPSIPLAGWQPADDDILPHTQTKKRKNRRSR
jgi:hypothetical protein